MNSTGKLIDSRDNFPPSLKLSGSDFICRKCKVCYEYEDKYNCVNFDICMESSRLWDTHPKCLKCGAENKMED